MQQTVLFIAKNSVLNKLGQGVIERLGLPFTDAGTENHILMGLRRASYFHPNIIFLDCDLPYMGVSVYLDMLERACGMFRVLLYCDKEAAKLSDPRLTAVLGPDDLFGSKLQALFLRAAGENERLYSSQSRNFPSSSLFEKLEYANINPKLSVQLSSYFSNKKEPLTVLSFCPDLLLSKSIGRADILNSLSPHLGGQSNTFFDFFEKDKRGCLITSQASLCDRLLYFLSSTYGKNRFYFTRSDIPSSADLAKCYSESIRRLALSYFEPEEKCLDVMVAHSDSMPDLDAQCISLLQAVLEHDIKKINSLIDHIYFDTLLKTNNINALQSVRCHIGAVYFLTGEMSNLSQHCDLITDYRYLTQEVIGLQTIFINMSSAVSPAFHGLSRYVLTSLYIIHLNYNCDLTLGDLALRANVTAPYLSTIFHNELGITLKDYLAHVRIKQAMLLLQDSNMKVADIAAQVGLSDARYFSRVFREQVGMTPTEYRCGKKKDTE